MGMKQSQATINAVFAVLDQAGVKYERGQDVRPLMTKELRAQVNVILFEGFRAGQIEMKEAKSDTELKSYVSGLQSNWLNKSKELNGGVKHEIKNPGSRTGSTDAQVKALRALLGEAKTDEEKAEVQEYLDARLEQLGMNKPKQVKVNFDDLPAELKAKYGK